MRAPPSTYIRRSKAEYRAERRLQLVAGKPVGKIVRDDFTGHIGFVPREGEPAPPARSWRSVDELKNTLRNFYESEKQEDPQK